jgi:hypothetical protein
VARPPRISSEGTAGGSLSHLLDWHETLEALVALVGRKVVVVAHRTPPLVAQPDDLGPPQDVFTLEGIVTSSDALAREDEGVEVRVRVGKGLFTLQRDLWATTSRDDDGTIIIQSHHIVVGVGPTSEAH